MALLFTNNAATTLSAGYSDAATTMVVAAGKGALFPTPAGASVFRATIVRASDSAIEIVEVTARTTDTMTVVRAREGTSALTLVAGDKFELRITAGFLNDTASLTGVAPATFAATSKATPVDADSIPLVDSAASNVLKKLTWANIKATLKTYFDTLYATLAGNTFTGAQIYSDQVLSRGMTKDMGMVFLDKGNSGTAAQTCDYTVGSHQKLTVTGAFVMNAVTNWPPTGNTGELLLELVNGASSAITWTMSGTTQKWWKSDGTSVATYALSGVTFQTTGTNWILMWSTDAGTTTNFKVMT